MNRKRLIAGQWVLNIQPVIPITMNEPDNGAEWQLRFQFQFLFPK